MPQSTSSAGQQGLLCHHQQHSCCCLWWCMPAGWTSTHSSRCLWAHMETVSNALNGWNQKVGHHIGQHAVDSTNSIAGPVCELPKPMPTSIPAAPPACTGCAHCRGYPDFCVVGSWAPSSSLHPSPSCAPVLQHPSQSSVRPVAVMFCRPACDSQLGRPAVLLGPPVSRACWACAGCYTARQGLQPHSHQQQHHCGHIRQAPRYLQHQQVSAAS